MKETKGIRLKRSIRKGVRQKGNNSNERSL